MRPAYIQIRIEAVGHDWAVGRGLDYRQRTYLINSAETWDRNFEEEVEP